MTVSAPALADIKLIASDMDGTLLKGWRRNVDPRAFPLIEALAVRGVPFFAASGRQYPSLQTLFAPVKDLIGYVCENGALAIYRGETLLKHTIPQDKALEICHAIMDEPDCDLLVSGERTSYALTGNAEFIDHLINVVKNDVTPVARPEDIPEPMIKVSYRVPDNRRDETATMFNGMFGAGYRTVTSGTIWVDITQDGTDKGTALAAVGKRLGIDAADMLAFGDELNDVEMLDFVGHPYLMESGNPVMRNLNDRVRLCADVEGELARLLGMAASKRCTE